MEKQNLTCNASYGECPVCGVNKQWDWYGSNYPNIQHTNCGHCDSRIIFYDDKLIYPKANPYIKPNELLNNYPKSEKLFSESIGVSEASPRAGLALSRMCLESLVGDILKEAGDTLADTFSKNVEKLLTHDIITNKIKKILDDVRVIGNKSIHNFNIIETDNEPTLNDCMLVWKAISHILDSLKLSKELEVDLNELSEKVKNKD